MEAHVLRLHFLAPKSPLLVTFSVSPSAHSPLLRLQRRPLYIRATGASGDDDGSPPLGQPITPPETVNIRFRRRSRKRRQQRDGVGEATARAVEAKQPAKAKSWEEMSLQEKAMELYVGEKGLLFWLNKLAYASIFAVIGGWIVFRFVGPSLNLYQLDSPPLSPTSLFKG